MEKTIRSVRQVLQIDTLHQERLSSPNTLFTNTGRRLYVIGDIDGRFRPRTNPYDLHAFGGPNPNDPLAEKLQGVWAQPVKGFSGYSYAVEVDGDRWDLCDAETFTQSYSAVKFDFHRPGLRASRCDFIPLDLPVLLSTLSLSNEMDGQALPLRVVLRAQFDLEDAWFTQLATQRNIGEQVTLEEGCAVARAEVLPEQWAAAVNTSCSTPQMRVLEHSTGEICVDLVLMPGETQSLKFALAVVHEGGVKAAIRYASQALEVEDALLEEKQAHCLRLLQNGPVLHSPDEELNAAFRIALLNLQMLEAESSRLGRYFYAGIEIFPFWFSCDSAYSAVGLLAGGWKDTLFNHIRIGMDYQTDGRVPHQISPSGKTAFAGNAQETSQWVMSVWDAYRWTGDRAFLNRMYPGVVRGLLDYTLGAIDPDGDGYPSGPGMVEVEGMGEEKLDSAAYAWAALKTLVEMAALQADSATGQRAREWIQKIEANFEIDWWDAEGQTYAMSLLADNQRYPVPHWAVVVPLEVGLASPEHAAATLATLKAHYMNAWGLKHTVGEDERVWTLPTATLSRAAFRYGDKALGLEMLHRIADTLQHGSIGMFHELIPEGACFIQLWSAATFIRGVVEDLLGLQVRVDRGEIRANPRLPEEWKTVRLENLRVGDRVVNVKVEEDGSVLIEP